jgi:hypothetical protein
VEMLAALLDLLKELFFICQVLDGVHSDYLLLLLIRSLYSSSAINGMMQSIIQSNIELEDDRV